MYKIEIKRTVDNKILPIECFHMDISKKELEELILVVKLKETTESSPVIENFSLFNENKLTELIFPNKVIGIYYKKINTISLQDFKDLS